MWVTLVYPPLLRISLVIIIKSRIPNTCGIVIQRSVNCHRRQDSIGSNWYTTFRCKTSVTKFHPSPINLRTKSFHLLPCSYFPFSFFFHQSKLVHLPNQQCPCHHQVPGSYTRECLFFNTFVIFTLPTSKRLC